MALRASVWDDEVDEARVLAGDEEAVRTWVAARAMAPLARLLSSSDREIAVLETVNADAEQRRRLRRSRRLARALRHLRQGRRDDAMAELVEAERDHPDDPHVALAAGFALMLDDRLDRAARRLEEMADGAPAELRGQALLTAARIRLCEGRIDASRADLESLADEEDGVARAEARYLLVRCRILEGADGSHR